MGDYSAEDIYYTMCGELAEGSSVPGIENAFAEGSFCDLCYAEIGDACQRLYDRLGVDTDEDVERILVESLHITKYLCLQMYEYGKNETKRE